MKSIDDQMRKAKKFLFGGEKKSIVFLELELTDQTVIAEKFEEGQEVFFRKDEDNIKMPEGEYTTKDGKQLLSIDKDGKILKLEDVPETPEEQTKDTISREEFVELQKQVEELATIVANIAGGTEEKEEMFRKVKKLEAESEKTKVELSEAKTLLSKIKTPEFVHKSEEDQVMKTTKFNAINLPPSLHNIFKQFNHA